jgi:hypothetical protein
MAVAVHTPAAVQASHDPPHAALQQMPPTQVSPLTQSLLALHPSPWGQRVTHWLVLPPQSVPVSLESSLPLLQLSIPPQPSGALPHVRPRPEHVDGAHEQFGATHLAFVLPPDWHWLSFVQPEHTSMLLTMAHESPLPHPVPGAAMPWTGVVPLQVQGLQPVGSLGTLVGSGMVVVLPDPSHTFCWQFPGVCEEVGVFAAVKDGAQALLWQAGCWQSLFGLVPAHSLSIVHCEHSPAALQKPAIVPM